MTGTAHDELYGAVHAALGVLPAAALAVLEQATRSVCDLFDPVSPGVFALKSPEERQSLRAPGAERGQLISHAMGVARRLWAVDAARASNLSSALRSMGVAAGPGTAARVIHELDLMQLHRLVEKLEFSAEIFDRARAQREEAAR